MRTTRARTGRDPDAPSEGWTSETSSGLALAGFLLLVFGGFTALAMGRLSSIDTYFNLAPPPPGWVPVLHALDRIGQRAVCLPVLALVIFGCVRHSGSWRPVWLALVSVFVLNLLVLVLKLGLGRAQPDTADPSFFAGGMAYPSGHTANILLVYGLAVYLADRYGVVPRRVLVGLWSGVFLLSVLMVLTSLTLNWHWFADLVAGLLVGGAVLQATIAIDFAVPVTLARASPVEVLRRLASRSRGLHGLDRRGVSRADPGE